MGGVTRGIQQGADFRVRRAVRSQMKYGWQKASEELEAIVANQKSMAVQMLESLRRNPSCGMDQLVTDCSGLTWNQLYCEVARLHRRGQLCLTRVNGDSYFLRLPQQQRMSPLPVSAEAC